MDLTKEQLFEIAQFSIVRMDGAWFMALARELGVDTAWEMDVQAWKQFSYTQGPHRTSHRPLSAYCHQTQSL
jgi:hypothetical protein